MEKFLINLICELDEKTNDVRLCSLYKRKNFKSKQRKMLLKNLMANNQRRIPKVLDYFNVIKKYTEDVFFNHFRMSRSTFEVSEPMYTV